MAYIIMISLLLAALSCTFVYARSVEANDPILLAPDDDISDNIFMINEDAERDMANTLIEGDIMMPAKQAMEYYTGKDVYGDLAKYTATLWNSDIIYEDGKKRYRIPYSFRTDFTQAGRDKVQEAIDHYDKETFIRFKLKNANDKNHIEFIHDRGCYSYIGQIGGAQPISLQNNGCFVTGKGIAVHEMMHAIGYYHEQSRPDRDTYITINLANLRAGVESNFAKRTSDGQGTDYDFKSIMHYGRRAFSANGRDTITPKAAYATEVIGQREGLSVIDIQSINLIYSSEGEGEGGGVKPTGPASVNYEWCEEAQKIGLCKHCSLGQILCKADCLDTSSSCEGWAKQGYCKGQYEGYMAVNCAEGCRRECIP